MQVARGFDVLHEVAAAPASSQQRAPAAERLRLQAMQLARSERLVDAAFCYRIVPLEAPAASILRAGGEQIEAPRLLPSSGKLTALACCACTLGPRLQERIRTLYAEHRMALGDALSDLAAELLAAVVRRAHDRIHADAEKQGLSTSGELRPGDPDLSAHALGAVLRLAGAERIGVALAEGVLHPQRSVSLVLGAGIDLPPADWSRCEECGKRRTCRVAARSRAGRPR